jgi:hypothetical protein
MTFVGFSGRRLQAMISKRFILAILFLTCSPLCAAGATSLPCSQAAEWVRQHQEELPRTYESFLKSPLLYRRAILAELPAEVRSELWRAHLERYLAEHPDLDVRQSAVIRQAIHLTENPDLFSLSQTDRRWTSAVGKPLLALELATRKAFSPEEAKVILTGLALTGEDERQKNIPLGGLCECSIYSDWCSAYWNCAPYAEPCTYLPFGCGTFGAWECNGTCYQIFFPQ